MRARVRRRTWRGRLLSAVTAVATLAGVLTFSGVATVAVAPAASGTTPPSATGTAGLFVPMQARIVDTRSGTGGFTGKLPANTWHSFQVDGVGGLPSTGISSVSVTLTVVSPGAAGNLYTASSAFTGAPTTNSLIYDSAATGTTSGAAMIAVGSDGQINIRMTTSETLLIDVDGYFTSGDGSPAPGGYVPINPKRFVDTRNGTGFPQAKLASPTTYNVQVGGVSGIPADALGVFAVVNAISSDSAGGALTASGQGLNYSGNMSTALGQTVPLDSSGQIPIIIKTGQPIDLVVDIFGYYTAANGTAGAFTPASTRVFDSRVAPNTILTGNAVTTISLAGIKGVPAAGSGISAIAVSVQSIKPSGGTAAGSLRLWAADQTETQVTQLAYPAATGNRSALAIVRPAADGTIKVRVSGADNIHLVLDVVGWYSNVTTAVPANQTRTQKYVTLQAGAGGGGPWVTYQYRKGITGAFSNVPVGDATLAGSSTHPSAWPVTTNSGGAFDAYTWDMATTVGNTDQLIQVQACFGATSSDAPSTLVCSMPSNIQLAAHAFGDSYTTTDIGPGTLAELTGDYQISATDASVASYLGSLTVGRTFDTLAPVNTETAGPTGVFGPGWTGSFPGSDDGEADLTVTDQTSSAGYLLFTGSDGAVSAYQATTAVSTYPVAFAGVDDAASDGAVVSKTSATHITMTDPDGTVTAWDQKSSVWVVSSVTQTGSATSTTYTTDATGRITRILGAVPTGVTCTNPDTTPGCRSMTLAYTTMTVGGVSVTRLAGVNLVAYDPATSAMRTVAIAAYDYNATTGRLADEYDPRITPNLKTAYTYDSNGRLATITPPGLAAWTFGYDAKGRLATASRPDPSGSTATSTISYGVPITGAGAPVDVGAAAAAAWGQTADLAATGTAVFSPNHVPAATPTSSDWPWSSLTYMDVNGRTVNTAAYGASAWQVDATQYDGNGNNIWSLTAGNLAQSLSTTADTDSVAVAASSTAARANLLASLTVYNPLLPQEVTDTFGPIHPVMLMNGSTVHARSHTATAYDEGAPDTAVYALPTTIARTAQDTAGVDYDPIITRNGYAAIVSGDLTGWALHLPTTVTTQMGAAPSSADLVTTTRYNPAGQVIEKRLPAGPAGGDAHTTVTTFYTTGTSGSCVSNALAGQVCTVGPAAQPTTGNPLPTSATTYNIYDEPLAVSETAGSTVRTSTTTYDSAGRTSTVAQSVTPTAAGGTAIPTTTTGYDAMTGLVTTVTAGGQTLTTGYDTLGRLTSYTDANSVTSSTTYDLSGRVLTHNDGKGTVTNTYDTSAEHRGMVTSDTVGAGSAPGTYSGTYDFNGNLVTQTLPNGLVATRHYDNDEGNTSLSYAKSGSTWLSFTASMDAESRIVDQTSPQSHQHYTFDPAGRLITVADNAKATTGATSSTCITRVYTFDADSNRTSLASYPDGGGSSTGTCTTSTTPTTVTSTYDQADRLINTGYAYDTLGRTTSVPAADAQGIGSHAGTTGNLTVGYYSNDMVASQAQGSQSRTYALDPDLDRIASTTTGTVTVTNHYDSDSDSPSWTATGTSWSRDISDIEGNLGGVQSNTGAVTLQLTNLHDDVVATVDDNTGATAVGAYFESTEYGVPRNAAATPDLYSWLGGKQRSTDTFGGLTLMGVRLYNPITGRFLSVDPQAGGNPNAYTYPLDPGDDDDTTGTHRHHHHHHRHHHHHHRHHHRYRNSDNSYSGGGGSGQGIRVQDPCAGRFGFCPGGDGTHPCRGCAADPTWSDIFQGIAKVGSMAVGCVTALLGWNSSLMGIAKGLVPGAGEYYEAGVCVAGGVGGLVGAR